LVWEVPLNAGISSKILITYNYRPLFWIFLIIVVILVAYFIFRTPIIVRKRASIVSTQEGGISELKIVIELINRGRKIAHNVKVMDLAPRLADVIKDTRETILAPSKVVPHEERGTLVRWDIDMMESKEHRIVMYKLRTKLGIIGGLSLPVTAVHFVVDGHEREAVSNKPEIKQR